MSGFGAMMVGSRRAVAAAGGGGTSYRNLGTAGSYLNGSIDAMGTGDFTVEFWMYNVDATTTAGINRNIIDTRSSGGNNDGIFIYYNPAGDTIVWHFQSGGSFSTAAGLSDNAWHHIALVRSGGVARGFTGGVYRSFLNNTTDKSSTVFRIGAFIDDSSANAVWNGYIDDLRVSSIARYTGTTTFTPPGELSSDADTTLLLNMNGVDGGTTFTDSGPDARTITRNGTGATTSSVQFKY